MAAIDTQVKDVLERLKRKGTPKTRDGMARFGIVADKAFGVTMGDIKAIGKELGRDHELVQALWKTGWYEARLLTSFVDDPDEVTPKQMDQWCCDFDNWAVCDTLCFHLFDRTPHAFAKIDKWAKAKPEFERRASFALLASVALHDKKAPDEPFLERLPLIEQWAHDERNFVKKAVSWALRSIGGRNPKLYKSALELGKMLAKSEDKTERWVGKDVVRGLSSAPAKKRLEKQKAKER